MLVGVGSDIGTTERGAAAIDYSICWLFSGSVSEVGSGMPLVVATSVEGFILIWAIGWGLRMITEDR